MCMMHVPLDRALFPLLAGIGKFGLIGVVELADRAGRDHTTGSRQVARLEKLDLVQRQETPPTAACAWSRSRSRTRR